MLDAVLQLIPCLGLEKQRILYGHRVLEVGGVVHADVFPPPDLSRAVLFPEGVKTVHVE